MKTILTLLTIGLMTPWFCNAQNYSAGTDTTIGCGSSAILNCANVYPITTGPNFDDSFSSAINIGFNFTFYGNTYTQCVIGGNGIISFNLAYAGGLCPWAITTALPSATAPANSILFPWQDLYIIAGGTFCRATIGTAPNRIFVVEYCNVSMFNCTASHFTGQVLLYETSNIIETHIYNKPVCTAWNNGRAIHGLQNSSTLAHIVPGRNSPTQWTASNDGKRFTPVSSTSYTITSIPYAPIPMLLNSYAWYENGSTLIGNTASIMVSPLVTTYYVATSQTCSGTTVSDTVYVNVASPANNGSSIISPACFGDTTGMITLNPVWGNPPYLYQWSTGDTTSGISNLAAGNYYCTITDSIGCVSTDTFSVLQPALLSVILSSSPTDASCVGSATAVPAGGTPSYAFQWNNGGSTSTINNLCSGWYTVTVTDSSACEITDSVFVSLNTGILDLIANPFDISPNPTTTDVTINFGKATRCNVQLLNTLGEMLEQTQINSSSHTLEMSSRPRGIYFVTVTDEAGNKTVRKIVKM